MKCINSELPIEVGNKVHDKHHVNCKKTKSLNYSLKILLALWFSISLTQCSVINQNVLVNKIYEFKA